MIELNDIINRKTIIGDVKSTVVLYKGETYSYFDSGLTRHVFVNSEKTKVIKFVIESFSYDFNQEEFDVYKNSSEEAKKLMIPTTIGEGGIIEQDYCNPIKFDKRKMSIPQMLFANSCRGKVGWNSQDELVCFDLSEFKKY